ncbi:TnsA-like heteromeric transposase endonuclease subunit [Mycolicibacterium porcinum]|uniref:TnsA-like heteromeric transposase endonuclease subunit n=1 Tax=Mycolicibacterium porcinum TaxID=39693 RepID=UPI0009F586EA|nr:TnsA-like heteromeric transposase endonuclease subunit [Mycolicibacterium porcinum]
MAGNLEIDLASAVIEYRPTIGELCVVAAQHIPVDRLLATVPRRTFTWYVGQRNYPGIYWSVTEQDHVIYESRLELSALLFCDFDRTVQRIKAQPFRMAVAIDGRVNRHVPDFLLSTPEATVVVDVVREKRLAEPKIQRLCEWTRRVTRSLSWDYRVMSEPLPMRLANLRCLAGYRREDVVDGETLSAIREVAANLVGMRFDDAERYLGAKHPKPLVRSALLHALWCQDFRIDLDEQFGPSTLLEESK